MTDGSPFIRRAKARAGLTYDLGASGVPHAGLEDLDPRPEDVAVNGPNLKGWPPLLERIAGRYGVEEEQVVTAHGASMANHLVFSALLEPGDEVLVEDPAYEPLRAAPAHLGAAVRTFPRRREEGWRLDPAAVEERLTGRTRLVVLTDLHNPTGRRADGEALRALAGTVREGGARLLVDEVYLEWLHPEGAATAARHPGVVATRSLTKAYGLDGLRAGWVLAPPEVAERLRRVKDLFSVTTAHPTERLAARALDRADALLGPARERVERNRSLVADFVEDRPELSWTPPDGGTVCFPRLERGSVEALVGRLEREHDATVAPGRYFGAEDHFRLGFGMGTEVLEEGLRRLGRALEEG